MSKKIRVTVWNEFRHEKESPAVQAVYPKGIHQAIADFLNAEGDFEVRTATLEEPDHGLTQEVLDNTDVLFWWGHCAHGEVRDEIVDRIQKRILSGMGLEVGAIHTQHEIAALQARIHSLMIGGKGAMLDTPRSVPIGELGRDGKGDTPEYPDRGVRLRAIVAAGKQDVAWGALTPLLPGAQLIGASSDHMIIDVEDCAEQVSVGDWMAFRCGYMAVLDATTSAYVEIRTL